MVSKEMVDLVEESKECVWVLDCVMENHVVDLYFNERLYYIKQ